MRHIVLSLLTIAAASASAAPISFEATFAECTAAQLKQAPFSGIVAAGMGDQRFTHVSGFADGQNKISITRETPFRLASVGKLFTRTAIGILADSGKLGLDDSVRSHLPELPPSFEPIKISHLLHHRSGVAPMTRPDMADAPVMSAAKSSRDLVVVVAAKPLSFAAGSQEQYSNGGYLILGAVIEAVSRQNYREYVQGQIFSRLGMKTSGFVAGQNAAVPLTRMTAAGQAPAATPQPRIEFEEFKASSAGDALSSAADLEAFAIAIAGDGLLSAKTKAAVFPQRSQPWRLGQLGGSVGSNTAFWVLPERNTWLVILSNFDPPSGELMSAALSPLLTGEPCKTQEHRAMQMTMPVPMQPPRGGLDATNALGTG